MPNIILDLRECTVEQKELVLRVMTTEGYRWASGHQPLAPPFSLEGFTYLFIDGDTLLKGSYQSVEEVHDLQRYDYIVPNISTWFAIEEIREEAEADRAAYAEASADW